MHRLNRTCRTRLLGLVLGMASLVLSVSSPADTLYLREGEQMPGRLIEITAGTVRFEGTEGIQEWPKAEVLKIQLQQARQWDAVTRVDEIADPELAAWVAEAPGPEAYPAAGSVTLYEKTTYDLRDPEAEVLTVRSIRKVLRQRGEAVATTNVWHFEDTDEARVDYALTVTPDGRVLHLDDAALKTESIHSRFPDYRRLARKRFASKEPRPGAILDTQYTVVRKRPSPFEDLYGEILFRDDEPVLEQEVQVIVPLDREKTVAAQLTGPDGIAFEREEEEGNARLTWRLKTPQRGIVPEPLMPPRADFAPRLVLGEAATWEDVSTAYHAALEALPPLAEAAAAKAVALDDAGGAQAIHDFVARSIRTAPVNQRNFSMVPHDANATLARGLANELDKNFLYYKMLDAAGIPCAFALLRSRDQGPLADEVASVRAFDGSAVLLMKGRYFDTAASDVLPFQTLPGDLHGAPALVIGADGGQLTTTQQPLPQDEMDATLFTAGLDKEGLLKIEVTYRAKGNAATWMRGLKDANEEQLRNTMERVAASLHPAARLEDYTASDFADLTTPPFITLMCAVPGYATKAGEELMLFNLPAVHYSANDVGRPTREHALAWPRVSQETTTGTLRLPEGYSVYSAPEDVAFESPTASYVAVLTDEASALAFSDSYKLKVDHAPAEAYGEYKTCLEERARVPRQRIILTR